MRKSGFNWIWIVISISVAATAKQTRDNPCVISGSTPFPIWPTQIGGPGNGSCAPGYYCPNINATDTATWPSICPATANCTVRRLRGRVCEPQGLYEPIICPSAYYCPTFLEKVPCPEGSFCPTGSTTPIKCSPLSICPAGSEGERYMLGLLINLLVDAAVVACWLTWKLCTRQKHINFVASVKLMAKDEIKSQSNSDLCEGFARSRGSIQPISFEFDNLGLELPGKKKKILQEVTGAIEPGTVTAILGPSGAGKTTFLSTLMGKVDSSWKRSGSLKINGDEAEMTAFKSLIGYVPQDDVMHRELNVWQNLKFSAEMRLPNTWTPEQRELHVEAVLHALHLTDVKYTRVGDESERGISGGQRKRVNIGIELAAAPLALFLDEPTSGLDATNAKEVSSTLQKIAVDTGITVVVVLHQPRPEIWHSLHSILLLAPGGRTVYQGPQSQCQKYFERDLGVLFNPHENPADIIMDAMARQGTAFADKWKENGPGRISELITEAKHEAEELQKANEQREKRKKKQRKKSRKSESNEVASIISSWETTIKVDDLDENKHFHIVDPENVAKMTKENAARGAPFFKQIWLTMERSVKQQFINITSLLFENILAIAAGLVIGYAADGAYSGQWIPPYTLISPAPNEGLLPQRGMYVNFAIGLAAASAGVRTFGEERVIYWREAASGHNRLAYFLGVTIASLPRIFMAALHFATMFHIVSLETMIWGEFVATVFLVWFAVYGMAAMLSMLVNREDAPLIAVVSTLAMSIFSGYASSIPKFLQYISYARWSAEAIYARELSLFNQVMQTKFSADLYDYNTDFLWQDLIIILSMGIIFRVAAFVFMIFRHRDKQR